MLHVQFLVVVPSPAVQHPHLRVRRGTPLPAAKVSGWMGVQGNILLATLIFILITSLLGYSI